MYVTPGGDFYHEQVFTDKKRYRIDILVAVSAAGQNRPRNVYPGIGVIRSGCALADVVQQGCPEQQLFVLKPIPDLAAQDAGRFILWLADHRDHQLQRAAASKLGILSCRDFRDVLSLRRSLIDLAKTCGRLR